MRLFAKTLIERPMWHFPRAGHVLFRRSTVDGNDRDDISHQFKSVGCSQRKSVADRVGVALQRGIVTPMVADFVENRPREQVVNRNNWLSKAIPIFLVLPGQPISDLGVSNKQ